MIYCDCKKRIWPWQKTGLDYQSHAACHWQRMVEFRKWQVEQNAKCDAAIEKALIEILRSEQVIELKAGFELDLAILKVLGAVWRDEWKDETGWKMAAWYYEDGSVACREQIPKFSTNLNAAFAAAEKTWERFWVKKLGPDKYEAIVFCDGDDGWSRFDEQPTPSLAICAAILKAKA